MDFEEWKRALDTEARRKAAKLGKENAHLKAVIKKKEDKIKKQQAALVRVCARCHEKGTDCRGCPERWRCEKIREGTE